MPVILLSTHNQGLDPPKERSSRLTNLSIGVLVSLHVIPTENTFGVPDFCLRCWEQEREPYGSVVIFILFEIVLTTEEEDKLFWQPFCFLIQIRESKRISKNHEFWNQHAKIVFKISKFQCY